MTDHTTAATLQIQTVKHSCKVVFVKNGCISNSNTLSFTNRHTAKAVLAKPLRVLFG